jgi:hypothetical protein
VDIASLRRRKGTRLILRARNLFFKPGTTEVESLLRIRA